MLLVEVPHPGASDKSHNLCFLWKNKKKNPSIKHYYLYKSSGLTEVLGQVW